MKRFALTLLLFLLPGAVVNVAVAWLCVHPTLGWRLGNPAWKTERAGGGPTDRIVAERLGIEVEPNVFERRRDWGFGWSHIYYVSDPTGGTTNELVDARWDILHAGWPAKALGGELLRVGDELTYDGLIWSRFPLLPSWPGFAVNTAFYAWLLWLLIRGPFALRRLIRRRRGLCVRCGYPTGDSEVCSECGKPVPGRTAAERGVLHSRSHQFARLAGKRAEAAT